MGDSMDLVIEYSPSPYLCSKPHYQSTRLVDAIACVLEESLAYSLLSNTTPPATLKKELYATSRTLKKSAHAEEGIVLCVGV